MQSKNNAKIILSNIKAYLSSHVIYAPRSTSSKRRLLLIILAVTAALYLGYLLSNRPPGFNETKPVKKYSSILPKEVSVELSDKGFSPKEVTIKVGTAIRWKNNSRAKQTVNSDDYPTNQKHKELNFGVFQDKSTFIYVFNRCHPDCCVTTSSEKRAADTTKRVVRGSQ